jgi:hypothetical protein
VGETIPGGLVEEQAKNQVGAKERRNMPVTREEEEVVVKEQGICR